MASRAIPLKDLWVCKKCAIVTRSRLLVQGSDVLEVVLWLCLIVPGIAYHIWRRDTAVRICSRCGGTDLIGASTAEADRIRHPD